MPRAGLIIVGAVLLAAVAAEPAGAFWPAPRADFRTVVRRDAAIGVAGSFLQAQWMGPEGRQDTRQSMPAEQRRLLEELLALRTNFSADQIQIFEQVLERDQQLSSEQVATLERILADVRRPPEPPRPSEAELAQQRELINRLLSLREYLGPQEVAELERQLARDQLLGADQLVALKRRLQEAERDRQVAEAEGAAERRQLTVQRDLLNQLLALRRYLGAEEGARLEQWLAGDELLGADRIAALERQLQEAERQRQLAEAEAEAARAQLAAQRELLKQLIDLERFLDPGEVASLERQLASDDLLGTDQIAALAGRLEDVKQRQAEQQLAEQRDLLNRLLALKLFIDPEEVARAEERLASDELLDAGQIAALERLLEDAERRQIAAARTEQGRKLAAQRDLLSRLLAVRGFLDPTEASRLEEWLTSEQLLQAEQIAALEVRLAWAEQRQAEQQLAEQRDLLKRLLALGAFLGPDDVRDLEQRLASDELLNPDQIAALEERLEDAEQREIAAAKTEQERRLAAQRDLLNRLLALGRFLKPDEVSRTESELVSTELLDADRIAALQRQLAAAEQRQAAEQLAVQQDLMSRLLAFRGYLDPGETAELEQRLTSDELLGPDQIAALEGRLEEAQERRMAEVKAEQERQLAAQRDLLNRLLAFRRYLATEEIAGLEQQLVSDELLGADRVAALQRQLSQAEEREAVELLAEQQDLLSRLLALRRYLDPGETAELEQQRASVDLLGPEQIAALERRLEEAQERRMAEVRAEQERKLAGERDLLNRLLTLGRFLEPDEVSSLERQLASDELLGADQLAALGQRLDWAEQRLAAERLAEQHDLLNRLLALRRYLEPGETSRLEQLLASKQLLDAGQIAAWETHLAAAQERQIAEAKAEEERRELAAQRDTIKRLIALDVFLTPEERSKVQPLSRSGDRLLSPTQMAQIEQLLNDAEQRRPTLLYYDMPRPRPL